MRYIKQLLLISALLVQGCAIYKIDIQQGNEITARILSNLEIGMTKKEVREVLGNPLVNDPFHTNRWDYYFYLKKGATGEVQHQSAILLFEGDELIKIKSSLLDLEENVKES